MKKLAILLLCIPMIAFAADDQWFTPLSRKEIMKEVFAGALGYVDYRQTVFIRDNPKLFYERNPLIGDGASDARIRNYFMLSTLTHIAITKMLPERYRSWWQNSTMTLEVLVIGHNRNIGIKAKF